MSCRKICVSQTSFTFTNENLGCKKTWSVACLYSVPNLYCIFEQTVTGKESNNDFNSKYHIQVQQQQTPQQHHFQ